MDPAQGTVIVEHASDGSTGTIPGKTMYARGCIESISGGAIQIVMPIGRHEFSRKDGRWLAGDCLNYKDGAIMDFEKVEAAIQGGHMGDVQAYLKSPPMCAADERVRQ